MASHHAGRRLMFGRQMSSESILHVGDKAAGRILVSMTLVYAVAPALSAFETRVAALATRHDFC